MNEFDYLLIYRTRDGFDISRLLNDDFLRAFKLCWNNRHYVSAAKLLMSFLDTLGYLEFGDTPRNFQRWLETYADLTVIGVAADELWEFRNSLLHMTNLESRKVTAGHVRRLTFYVAQSLPKGFPNDSGDAKHFGLWQLFDQVIVEALVKYADSFNVDRHKFSVFVDRYDRLVSASRYVMFDFGQPGDHGQVV